VTATEFAYTQARIQARHAQRPDEATWARLHASTTLAHFLTAARATGLRRWVAHLKPGHAAQDIERSLGTEFRSYVREVASWLPERWQDATRAVGELPLASEGEGKRLLELWRARWPRASVGQRRALNALVDALSRHSDEMATAASTSDGWLLRAALGTQLARLFRAEREQPTAVFCHLGMIALDVERLRGALLRRALFEDVRSDVAWV
jgi:hypothetical protein